MTPILTEVPETLAVLVSSLRRLATAIHAADPLGADWALRLTVSHKLYACYDTLRCADRPFERQRFSRQLEAVERTLRSAGGAERPPEEPQPAASPEAVVADLYSRCWSHYGDREFLATAELFQERFQLNGISVEFLRGAACLDAGCGSGRYTVAMARLGARQVTGLDLGERVVREAEERSRRLDMGDEVRFCQGSVLALPAAWTGVFDFVCSNGVLHHTTNPLLGLQEIARVLKPGGRAYVFVYGAGGLFWELVDVIRALVTPVPLAKAEEWLVRAGLPPGKLFNFLDHWYTPIQERITRQECESRLHRCGFTELRFMPRAKVYDASERRVRFPEERDLIGEGDLRYLVEKPA